MKQKPNDSPDHQIDPMKDSKLANDESAVRKNGTDRGGADGGGGSGSSSSNSNDNNNNNKS